MDAYQETFRTWDKVAGLYQEKFMDRKEYNESYQRFIQCVDKDQIRVLEIACGPGNMARYFLSQKPEWKWEGFDVSFNMVELARKNVPNAEFWVMDVRELDGIGLQYDAVLCGFGIPYLSEKDLGKFIADLNKLLLPGGMIYLSFVEGKTEDSGFKTNSVGDRVYFNFHQKTNLEKLFSEQNMHLTESFEVAFSLADGKQESHSVLFFQKDA